MSGHHAKYLETIEGTTVFMQQFCFIHIFIIFQTIRIGPDVSKNGHGVVLVLRIKEHGKLACKSKPKLCLRLIGYCFTEIAQ